MIEAGNIDHKGGAWGRSMLATEGAVEVWCNGTKYFGWSGGLRPCCVGADSDPAQFVKFVTRVSTTMDLQKRPFVAIHWDR